MIIEPNLPFPIEVFLRIVVFLLGATIGSFLNVVIYRLPLGLKVNDPKRSFCPDCKYQIPVHQNIPIFSWVALRGRCANCKGKISARYVIVEALTAVLFLLVWEVWRQADVRVVLAYWVLIALFIATVYIDFDHFIIPDQITIGGAVAGVLFATVAPALMEKLYWWQGLLWSLVGAAAGLGLLWVIVELGKRAFGQLKLEFDGPQGFVICQDEDEEEPAVTVDDEKYLWSDLFFRSSDKLIITADEVEIGADVFGNVELVASEDGFQVRKPEGDEEAGGFEVREFELESLERIDGKATKMVVPREAMGFGDVKFMALVGAFLGWQAVLFTVFAASVLGTAVALPARLSGRLEWAAKIPFGPYLVAGATIWMFFGDSILFWYTSLGGR